MASGGSDSDAINRLTKLKAAREAADGEATSLSEDISDDISVYDIGELDEDGVSKKMDSYLRVLNTLTSYDNTPARTVLQGLEKLYFKQPDLRDLVCKKLVEGNFADLAVKMFQYFNSIGIFKSDDVWFPAYYTFSSCWNYSDTSQELAKQMGENRLLAMMLNNLSHKPYLDNQGKNHVMYILKASLSILHNLARVPDNKQRFAELDAVETIKPFTQSKEDMLLALSYLTLSHIVDENQSDDLADSGSIRYLVDWMNQALNDTETRRYEGFTPQELAEGLAKLAVNDSNKLKIVEAGALPVFVSMMQSSDEGEQSAAAQALWTLSFDEQVKQKIIAQSHCIEMLEALTKSETGKVKKAAKGALWKLKDEARKSQQMRQVDSDSDGRLKNHVFISYNWGSKEVVLRISNALKAQGFRVWIDVDQMGGSTLEAMARAVEDAAVVVICMSEKYKLSPNCRTEAEYTFQLNKPIVPLMMQRKYKPDGWLGMILGAKLYINFDGKHPFDEAFQMFLKELADRGKGEGGPKDGAETVEAVMAPITASKGRPPPGISKWSATQVTEWLSVSVGLHSITEKFSGCNGEMLLALHKVRYEAPQFFYDKLDKMGLDLMDILRLVAAMDKVQV